MIILSSYYTLFSTVNCSHDFIINGSTIISRDMKDGSNRGIAISALQEYDDLAGTINFTTTDCLFSSSVGLNLYQNLGTVNFTTNNCAINKFRDGAFGTHNNSKLDWVSPVAKPTPTAGVHYEWNESEQKWEAIQI